MIDLSSFTENEKIKRLREELSEISKRAYSRRLVGGTGGNISVRVPGTDKTLITPSGVGLGDVSPESSILCAADGSVLDSPQGYKPSKESSFHLGIYRMRPEAGAVAHVHPPYATAYANQGKSLPMITVSALVRLKQVPCIQNALPGSLELHELVLSAMEKYPEIDALLMRKHGIVALGTDLRAAFYTADLVEDTAKIAFITANIPGYGE